MTKDEYQKVIESMDSSIQDALTKLDENLNDIIISFTVITPAPIEFALLDMIRTHLSVSHLRLQKILKQLNEEPHGTDAV